MKGMLKAKDGAIEAHFVQNKLKSLIPILDSHILYRLYIN
jgi:hypothetical protein